MSAPAAAPVHDTHTPGVQAWVDRGTEAVSLEAARRTRMRTRRFDTIAVHGVYDMTAALANQGSLIEPVYLSPAQHFVDSDQMEAALAYEVPAWVYSRIANPTLHYLEETLALLESYATGIEASTCVTGSGMAAVHVATSPFLRMDGDAGRRPNIVVSAKCYGGTFMLFSERYGAERGVDIRWVGDPLDLGAWAALIDDETRFVYGEVPSNPTVAMLDVPAVSRLAHEHGLPFIVDATVATPALMRPLGLGADIVVQSLSKSIGSSGLAIGGAVTSRRDIPCRVGPDALRADAATWMKLLPGRDHGGGALSPLGAATILADLRTLRARMDAWSRSAGRVATFLAGHPAVERVAYPGLVDDPGHEIARRDLWLVDGDADGLPTNRFGTLLAFTVRSGEAARRAFDRLELVWRATDLGRVKSVATIPAISTHQQQGDAGRALADIPAGLIRLSVGGEHPDDIIDDLERALAGA